MCGQLKTTGIAISSHGIFFDSLEKSLELRFQILRDRWNAAEEEPTSPPVQNEER